MIEQRIQKKEQIKLVAFLCEKKWYLQVSVALCILQRFRVISLFTLAYNCPDYYRHRIPFVIICSFKKTILSFAVWVLSLPLPTSALFFFFFFLDFAKFFMKTYWVSLLYFDLSKQKFGYGIHYEITKT